MTSSRTSEQVQNAKRKHDGDDSTSPSALKKARFSPAATQAEKPTYQAEPTSFPLLPHKDLLSELMGKYEVKIFSVLSSTSIQRRVNAILQHLGRFHPWDLSVLPGVVLLFAKAPTANKLISIIETVRRRVHEADQKWYQFNRLFEQEVEMPLDSLPETTIVEETVLAGAENGNVADEESDEEDDGFETMPTVFEQAIHPPKIKNVVYMSVFLARVPVPELAAKDYLTTETNEAHIDHLRKKRSGEI